MNNKIGRNDICFCGSGKKFKKCCNEKNLTFSGPEVADFQWRMLREVEGQVMDKHLSPYVQYELVPAVIDQAFSDFLQEELADEIDGERLFVDFFIPWLMFNWLPQGNFGMEAFDGEKTISENYLEAHRDKLNSSESRFIEAMNETFYSFYSVLEVEFEKTLIVKDILLGTKHIVKEKLATHTLRRGDIIFSRILTLDNQSIFIGMAPYQLPARFNQECISIKRWLIEEYNLPELNSGILRNFDLELLDCYFDILNDCYKRPTIGLVNTDGDIIQYCKSYFKLTLLPEAALNLLLPLTLSKKADEFLQEATRDSSGNVVKVEFPWMKKSKGEFTLLGHVTIEKNKLILEANSEKRTEKGKKLILKYLGDSIQFQKTVIESIDHQPKFMSESEDVEEDNIVQLPEMKEKIESMAKQHWEDWFDQPIPALDYQTPRDASKTEEGRERLEALLLQYEEFDLLAGDTNLFRPDFNFLREELGLCE